MMPGRFDAARVMFWVRFAKPLKKPLAVHAVLLGPSRSRYRFRYSTNDSPKNSDVDNATVSGTGH